jgi:type I restriction enzyme M protein
MPDQIELIPPGKLRCVITGKLRDDKPEENVRQRIARSLLDEYGYLKEDLELEFSVQLGHSRKRADLVIFPPAVDHSQQNIFAIVECKTDKVKPTDRDNGVEQLKSYMAASLNCRFGLWIGSELQAWEKLAGADNKLEFLVASDIPRFGFDAPQPLAFTELVPAHEELIAVFKRCHNYIYGNEGLQKEPAFQELLKLIFCKVYDEDTAVEHVKFFIGNEERRSEIGQRRLKDTIATMFEDVRRTYPYIFPPDALIQLSPRVLAYVVGELQRFSLLETQADVKGAAYEQLVGSNLRGDRGEFFTPRNICEMAARMVLSTFPEDQRLQVKVLDPACGTGGFLVACMNTWRSMVQNNQFTRYPDEPIKALDETRRMLRELADRLLLGIDFNPVLVRAAQMNLVMHGDGSTNIYHANSLLPPGEWPAEAPNDLTHHVGLGTMDVILTNPPFGSKVPVDDPHILGQFELASRENLAIRRSMPPEQLFIERCVDLLRPGGRLAIVLPDSILSNPGLAFIRRWILRRTRVIASIDLPTEAFQPYTGTQTSVLILQKKTEREMDLEAHSDQPVAYGVFMATPRAVGHDRRGETVYLRTEDGELIQYEEDLAVRRRAAGGTDVIESHRERRTAVHDDLPQVADAFEEWISIDGRLEWINGD